MYTVCYCKQQRIMGKYRVTTVILHYCKSIYSSELAREKLTNGKRDFFSSVFLRGEVAVNARTKDHVTHQKVPFFPDCRQNGFLVPLLLSFFLTVGRVAVTVIILTVSSSGGRSRR
ncbi:hypothetical protein PO909_032237 [Leuciscus waleckii]